MLARWIEATPGGVGDRAASNAPLSRARGLARHSSDDIAAWKELMSTPRGALALRIAMSEESPTARWTGVGLDLARETKHPLISDLVSPRLPWRLRRAVLGSDPDPKRLLAQPGVASRGEALFFAEGGVQCFSCHVVGGRGRAVGPDLSAIGRKYSREELLAQLLRPSARIDPEYTSWVADLRDGDALTGFLVSQTKDQVVLRDATGVLQSLPRSGIRSLLKSSLSLMPEGLLENLTLEEAGDLLEFLASRKQ